MEQFAGLNVSVKSTSICVVDGDGAVMARGEVPTHPDAIRNFFVARKIEPTRIVHVRSASSDRLRTLIGAQERKRANAPDFGENRDPGRSKAQTP